MPAETHNALSSEQALGAELVSAVETLLADVDHDTRDPALALQLATVKMLLALYWELRHQRPESASTPWTSFDSSLGWVSALLSSGLSAAERPQAP